MTTRGTTLRTRRWNGLTIPTAGQFDIDASHTTVGFVARHLMVTQVRGRFSDVTGSIQVADDPLETVATARIATSSLETGADERDQHLRSADFLDVEHFPTIAFTSGDIAATQSGSKWDLVDGVLARKARQAESMRVTGDLTIRDITRPIPLNVTIDGVTGDPWGGERLALTARGQIDREAYGMTWNVALEAGGWLVSRKIEIEIRAQAVRSG